MLVRCNISQHHVAGVVDISLQATTTLFRRARDPVNEANEGKIPAGGRALCRISRSRHSCQIALFTDGNVIEAACWTYARRKVTDLHAHRPTPTTIEVLSRIGELYAIEAEIRGEPPAVRQRGRQERARPLLASLERWLRERLLTLSQQS
jgi:hypothetical protein